MKKIFLIAILALVAQLSFAQAPQKMSYQSVVRNAANQIIANQSIGVKISIVEGSLTGTIAYAERHTTTTNANGLFTLEAGGGTPTTGTFATINWGNGSHYIKSEIDVTGGTNYTLSGTMELLSVPYALYAVTAGNTLLPNGIRIGDVLTWNGIKWEASVLKSMFQLPLAPTELIVTDILATKINLSWTDNSTSETGFKIQRKGATGNYATVGTVGADVTVYEDKGLTINTAYSYRVLSYNDGGDSITYSNEVSVSTDGVSVINTSDVINVRATSATVGGSVFGDGGSAITERGVVWSTSPNPTIALTTKVIDVNVFSNYSFSSMITGLNLNTKYYVRAYATNEAGTAYGAEVSFTTMNGIIVLATYQINNITATSAISGGEITTDGGAAITERGVVWSTSPSPTIALSTKTIDGSGTGSFASAILELSAITTYYVRAYATNSFGTVYGTEVSFTTLDTPNITNGTQYWQNTNLDVATYSDGTVIPQVTDPTAWGNLTTGAWCYDAATGAVYGKLYNWYAVAGIWNEASKTDSSQRKKLAPTGYHVPTDGEWTTLTDYLGGAGVAGGKMKESGTTRWDSPNADATNTSGFTALPGGYRNSGGTFNYFGYFGFWWSSSEFNTTYAWYRYLGYSSGNASRVYSSKTYGFSVRCLRD